MTFALLVLYTPTPALAAPSVATAPIVTTRPSVWDCPVNTCDNMCIRNGATVDCTFDEYSEAFAMEVHHDGTTIQVGSDVPTPYLDCCVVSADGVSTLNIYADDSGSEVIIDIAEGAGVDLNYVGGAGVDRVSVGDCDATSRLVVDGGPGDDHLTSSWTCPPGSRISQFHGGDGHDVIAVAPGATAYGDAGNDTLTCMASLTIPDVGCTLRGNDDNDTLTGWIFDDTLYGGPGNDTIVGDDGNDFIDGGGQDDIIDGDGGDDEIDAGVGTDIVRGGAGLDILEGGAGDDQIWGGPDTDIIYGDCVGCNNSGHDELWGEGGEDFLYGDCGNNTCDQGRDILHGGDDADWLYGELGTDVLEGGDGPDVLDGGDGDDVLCEDLGEGDTLLGGSGSDYLWYGSLGLIPPSAASEASGGFCGDAAVWSYGWGGTCIHTLTSRPIECAAGS